MKAFFAVLILVALLSQGLQACGNSNEVGQKTNNQVEAVNQNGINKEENSKEPNSNGQQNDNNQIQVMSEPLEVNKMGENGTKQEEIQGKTDTENAIQGETGPNQEEIQGKTEPENAIQGETGSNQEILVETDTKQVRVLVGEKTQVYPTEQTQNQETRRLEVSKKEISCLII